MIVETWRSADYDAARVERRYVKQEPDGTYSWIETATKGKNGWKWDIRSGTCDGHDLPVGVRARAREARERGCWPFWVEWPL